MQYGGHDNDRRRDAELKTEYFDSPGARRLERKLPESFNRQPSQQPKNKIQKVKLKMKCQFCTSYFDNLAQLLGHLHLHLERLSSKDLGLVCMVKDCHYTAHYDVNDEDEGNPRQISKQAGMSSAQPQAEAVSLKFWLVYV